MNIPQELHPEFAENGQIFWHRIIEKGIIRKKVVEVQAITNRAVSVNKQALDLATIDAIVLAHRHSRSIGEYQGYSFGAKGTEC